MEENMNNNENMESMNDMTNDSMASKKGGSGNGMFWTIVVVAILVIVGVWIWSPTGEAPTEDEMATSTDQQATTTEEGPEVGEDSSEDIQSQLEGINIEDLEGEFEQIDSDLNELGNEQS